MDNALASLRQYRAREGKTLDDIVKALREQCGFETTKATLSRIENGKQPVTLDVLRHLGTVTGLSVAELAGEVTQCQP